MSKQSALLSILLVLLTIMATFWLGFEYGKKDEPQPVTILLFVDHLGGSDNITVEQALDYIEEARFTHQLIVDKFAVGIDLYPGTGNSSVHQKWVIRYDQLKNLIIELDS